MSPLRNKLDNFKMFIKKETCYYSQLPLNNHCDLRHFEKTYSRLYHTVESLVEQIGFNGLYGTLKQLSDYQDAKLLVLLGCDNQDILRCVGLCVYAFLVDNETLTLFLSRFIVDAKYRNQGFGGLLFGKLKDTALCSYPDKIFTSYKIELYVEPDNINAIRFYNRCGINFESKCLDVHYYTGDIQKIPDCETRVENKLNDELSKVNFVEEYVFDCAGCGYPTTGYCCS
jgi:ribosomal protein S18 acetylase RimI-like enzyme